MNNSWNSSTQSSPGFVYFNNAPTTPQKKESSDFISFSDKEQSPTKNYFSPRNFSSPHHKQQRGSPRNNYHGRFKQNRFSNNQSFSPNKTYNSSFNHSNSNSSSGKYNISKGDKSFNKNAYLHPSFTENPWAELEAKLRQLKEESKQNKDSSGSDESDSNESTNSNT